MIKLTALYPNQPNARFDWDYLLNEHIQLVRELLGESLLGIEVERGTSGVPETQPAPFVCMTHLKFADPASFRAALEAAGPKLGEHMGRISDITPTMVLSEVVA